MKTTTFLTFIGENCGKANEAMQFYTSIFPNSEIISVTKFSEGEPGGSPNLVKHGIFSINGVQYMISENNYKHNWSISPGVSIFVQGESVDELKTAFDKLSKDGQIMVPIADYSGSEYALGKLFGWCADKYGVSWQVKLSE